MNSLVNFEKYIQSIQEVIPTRDIGKVTGVTGLILRGFVPGCSIGSVCEVYTLHGQRKILAEVVGFDDKDVLLMPLNESFGVGLGSRIVLIKTKASVDVGVEMLGRVLDGLGQPIDDLGPMALTEEKYLYNEAEKPMSRDVIDEPLSVGVRAIDGLITVGKGQRVAIMAGSGVGKSVLLGQMAKHTSADINVIALIGERGREVKEFVERILGVEGMKKSVVIAVTSDQSPLVRMRGAYLATTIAEYFAQQKKDVLLLMDSVTRFAMAQREVGLSAGEPPTTKGYTPSVFSKLPKLLERAGNFTGSGSITGLYSVLVEGDDMDDPIADSVRSIVDGHIVLNRKIAHKAIYPAIDVLQSTSRVMTHVATEEHNQLSRKIRENMATYNEAEDLINIGAYKSGANTKIDAALKVIDRIQEFLKQGANEANTINETVQLMKSIVGGGGR
jgi:flagellum-specific ATP synthase